MKMVLSGVKGAVFRKDTEGQYTDCNAAMVTLLGASTKKEIIGRTDKELLWQKHYKHLAATDKKVQYQQSTIIAVDRLLTSTGEQELMSIKMPILDKKGKYKGISGLLLEMTAESLLSCNTRLVKSLIQNEKICTLRQIKHDIQLPATGIVGLVQILKEQFYSNEAQKLFGYLQDAANSLNSLIEALSKTCESDMFDMEGFVLFDLANIVANVVSLDQPIAWNKNLEISVDLGSEPLLILSDQAKTFRIIIELVSNALKYTESGMIKLLASRVNNRVKFSIFNTSTSMPDSVIKQINEGSSEMKYDKLASKSGFGISMVLALSSTLGIKLSANATDNGTLIEMLLPQSQDNLHDMHDA